MVVTLSAETQALLEEKIYQPWSGCKGCARWSRGEGMPWRKAARDGILANSGSPPSHSSIPPTKMDMSCR